MNGQQVLEQTLQTSGRQNKKVLLHSCCAPCSSYVLAYLREYFSITVFYYNPNISAESEYLKRVKEQKRLIERMNLDNQNSEHYISCVEGSYEPDQFYEVVKGYEQCKEGGERCFRCYSLRLRKAAEYAKEYGYDFFATTLTVSPLKNAEKLNEIGLELEKELGVFYLVSDFKKKDGYKKSIELSRKYDLYRQDFCGCAFSKVQREQEKENRKSILSEEKV